MLFNLKEKYSELQLYEHKLINIPKETHESSYEHWSFLNTINHVYCWEINALNKVEARIKNENVNYHSDKSLEDVNKHYYEKTRDYSKDQTLEIMESTSRKALEIFNQIEGKEESKELVPIGYMNTVFDYLVFDLIYHGIIHYAFYAIKHNDFKLFEEVGKYIRSNRKTMFNDFGIMNMKELMTPKEKGEIFKKGYEWENDDLYIQIKHITV